MSLPGFESGAVQSSYVAGRFPGLTVILYGLISLYSSYLYGSKPLCILRALDLWLKETDMIRTRTSTSAVVWICKLWQEQSVRSQHLMSPAVLGTYRAPSKFCLRKRSTLYPEVQLFWRRVTGKILARASTSIMAWGCLATWQCEPAATSLYCFSGITSVC